MALGIVSMRFRTRHSLLRERKTIIAATIAGWCETK